MELMAILPVTSGENLETSAWLKSKGGEIRPSASIAIPKLLILGLSNRAAGLGKWAAQKPPRAPPQWPQPRLVIIEFPSRAAAEDWYKSAEYRRILSLRLKSSAGNLIIVDGFADQ
ncbi:DUF1330 domain-containing protein [Bradyrhizobium sp.]